MDSSWGPLFEGGNAVDVCVAADMQYLAGKRTAGGKACRATELEKKRKNIGSSITVKDIERARMCGNCRTPWLHDARVARERVKKCKHRFIGAEQGWIKELGGFAAAAERGLRIVPRAPRSKHELNVPPKETVGSPWDNIPDMMEYPEKDLKHGQYTSSGETIDKSDFEEFKKLRGKFDSFMVTIYFPRTVQTTGESPGTPPIARSSNVVDETGEASGEDESAVRPAKR